MSRALAREKQTTRSDMGPSPARRAAEKQQHDLQNDLARTQQALLCCTEGDQIDALMDTNELLRNSMERLAVSDEVAAHNSLVLQATQARLENTLRANRVLEDDNNRTIAKLHTQIEAIELSKTGCGGGASCKEAEQRDAVIFEYKQQARVKGQFIISLQAKYTAMCEQYDDVYEQLRDVRSDLAKIKQIVTK
jgi:hypothetical protein